MNYSSFKSRQETKFDMWTKSTSCPNGGGSVVKNVSTMEKLYPYSEWFSGKHLRKIRSVLKRSLNICNDRKPESRLVLSTYSPNLFERLQWSTSIPSQLNFDNQRFPGQQNLNMMENFYPEKRLHQETDFLLPSKRFKKSEVQNQGIQMAIVNRSHPYDGLNHFQAKIIKIRLDDISEFSAMMKGLPFEFLPLVSVFFGGILWVNCANLDAKWCLYSIVDNFKELWECCDLATVYAKDIQMKPYDMERISALFREEVKKCYILKSRTSGSVLSLSSIHNKIKDLKDRKARVNERKYSQNQYCAEWHVAENSETSRSVFPTSKKSDTFLKELLELRMIIQSSRINIEAISSQNRHSKKLHVDTSLPSFTPPKRRITSLQELDNLTKIEVEKFRLSGAAKKRLTNLLKNGYDYITGKKLIIKDNYFRLLLRSKILAKCEFLESKKEKMKKPTKEDSSRPKDGLLKSKKLISVGILKKKKKTKKSGEVSFRQDNIRASNALLNSVKIAVALKGYPHQLIEAKKLKDVEFAIQHAMEIYPPGTAQLRFYDCRLHVGFLLITPADGISTFWLQRTVPKLIPWKGAELITLIMRNPPKPLSCSVIIPNEQNQRIPFNHVLHRLKICNKNLRTNLWIMNGYTPRQEAQVWYLEVDDISYEELKKLNMKPYFGFGRVQFFSYVSEIY